MAETETCYGCGRPSDGPTHPIVAIVRRGDGFVAEPVCRTCHEVPKNRTMRKIKGHFFARNEAPRAIAFAGSDRIRG
jgi:hypothetical protein